MAKVKKGTKREFYEVKAPVTATRIQLYAHSPEELNNKIVKLDLTRSLKGKSIELILRVKQENNELIGNPESLELVQSYIRKMMRKGTDYVEDSFFVDCKDARVQIKPFMITRNKVSRSIRRELRNMSKKHIESYLKSRTTKEIFTDITTNKLQRELSLKLKKIYPLALCEIRAFRIVNPVKEVQTENPRST